MRVTLQDSYEQLTALKDQVCEHHNQGPLEGATGEPKLTEAAHHQPLGLDLLL